MARFSVPYVAGAERIEAKFDGRVINDRAVCLTLIFHGADEEPLTLDVFMPKSRAPYAAQVADAINGTPAMLLVDAEEVA
jgi:hypothetical protein